MEYLIIGIAYLVLINSITIIRLVLANEYEKFQKIIQFLLIWLLPIVGVLIVVHFLNDNPIIIKYNGIKLIIIKILLFPVLIKVTSMQKDINIDISSSNEMTSSTCGYGDVLP